MNKRWFTFLQAGSKVSTDPQVSCGLNDLSHYGLIRVEGEDALQFLQGQLTNDMREVTEEHSNLSGWCTAKGRMMANFRVFRMDDAFYLQTPQENLETVLKRLRMYVLMSKVRIDDVSDELVRFGITGDCAEALLQEHFQQVPASQNGALVEGNTLLVRLPGLTPRYEIIGSADTLIRLWQDFETQARPMSCSYWALQEIRAGIPTVFRETAEAFVPQMTNMQLIDGVSFTKGCYTGQEVVARMQYLGKLKRRMYLAHVDTDGTPRPGDELFAEGSTSGQGAGKVVDAQATGNGYDLLAVIEIDSAEGQSVHLGPDGPKLEISELPYEFASERN
jgi:folate-binding protein YgfZ